MSTHLDRILDVAAAVTRHRSANVSRLDHIVSIDLATRTCVAEPHVTFAKLVKDARAYGLAPRGAPPLAITLGVAVEHRCGGFYDACIEWEVVTDYGDIVRFSRKHARERFDDAHALGVLTALTFELTPVARATRPPARL